MNKSDKVWWLAEQGVGEWIFSFDRIHQFNLFADYPDKLTAEQRAIFDKENPQWKIFFADRS